jgi:hypothetical protein
MKTKDTLPARFEPRFWELADGRSFMVKAIRKRHDLLRDDVGVESTQQELLVQRAVFLSVQLETMEMEAVQNGRFDAGQYTQMTNALLGLLRTLGLKRQIKKAVNLEEYLEARKQ